MGRTFKSERVNLEEQCAERTQVGVPSVNLARQLLAQLGILVVRLARLAVFKYRLEADCVEPRAGAVAQPLGVNLKL